MNDSSDSIKLNYLSRVTSPKQIECHVEFIVVGKVDTINETFSGTFKIRSKWKENKIITSYNPDTDWNPKIYIENAIPDVNLFQEIYYKCNSNDTSTEITEIRTIKGYQI